MIVLYIILGFIGYILVASITYLLYKKILGKDNDAFWFFCSVVWPMSIPCIIVVGICIGLFFGVMMVSDRLEKIFKKKSLPE